MKSKMREKVRPKMGKIDIDYQKLHDAFFKWQTKPKLTIHGDLYYEVREGTGRQRWALVTAVSLWVRRALEAGVVAPPLSLRIVRQLPLDGMELGIRWSSEGDRQVTFLR